MEETNVQLKSLYANANSDVQAYLLTNDLDEAVAIFGKIYKLPVSNYLSLKNTITLILLGAIKPENAVEAFQKNCEMSASDAYLLAKDLEETVFQKVRLSILGKDNSSVKKIQLEDESATKEELRKEILDTTKRTAEKVEPAISKTITLQPGSRSQLLEQLQVLDEIPDDEEVNERLNKIKEQISSMDSKSSRDLTSNLSVNNLKIEEKGDEIVEAETKTATYSKAPVTYNVDPYREISE